MRVVVVGATGNLGSAMLTRLSREPSVTEIVGVARRMPIATDPRYSGVYWHQLDIGETSAAARLAGIFAGADAVVHLAWALQPNHDEESLWRTNVEGTKNVLAAVAAARVPQIAYPSSIAAYSPGPKTRRVDESWPTGGVPTSHYSRHKAINERAFDRFEEDHPSIVVTRFRPGFIFSRDAATEIAGLFVGKLIPLGWLRFFHAPFVPLPPQFVAQVVHSSDVADAFWRALDRRAAGAFNIAAEPVIDGKAVASVLDTRWLPIRLRVARFAAKVTWKLRLQNSDPGWIDLGALVPIMSTERARRELGWEPSVSSLDALEEILHGVAEHARVTASPQLRGM
ncbi:NAD-dependent epimerase/dehydratase family protein [Mycetocola zhadangensis]|uniref:NAD-dependent epimerase/dehydratase family protein n=1 Tax=Mycetocola zhadangensis TaxID=1164595 RepID=A0A3L7IWY5_9MICO|nr:NAD-dependent epimerase/dehydratase family protein [Mycetocola zhadangensis]RLQ82650.1 NAD-dependent epimerase/dehydratase family protein [Mycetocola zhadangensis]GGE99449.1 NAD-dependent epimerase [Mycetocola zhadangensis]